MFVMVHARHVQQDEFRAPSSSQFAYMILARGANEYVLSTWKLCVHILSRKANWPVNNKIMERARARSRRSKNKKRALSEFGLCCALVYTLP